MTGLNFSKERSPNVLGTFFTGKIANLYILVPTVQLYAILIKGKKAILKCSFSKDPFPSPPKCILPFLIQNLLESPLSPGFN